MPAGASGPHRGGYWPPSARSAVPKSKIRWLPRLRILTGAAGPLRRRVMRSCVHGVLLRLVSPVLRHWIASPLDVLVTRRR
ncbi:hypothetical protein JOD52_000494 [Brachybacterium muris]|uniref:hypothetical protein n=1 Tax=Brachybacterium muris TaxID=219301 RepID=UPI00195751F8|nr:hypothetical protein [Brachybacterium muris]MBM7499654.1 hypothetical protein [Brachybacterium muris]